MNLKKFLPLALYGCLALVAGPSHSQEYERIETDATKIKVVSGNNYWDDNAVISGRVFKNAYGFRIYGDDELKSVFSNEEYDVFEAYIGVKDDARPQDRIKFTVLGDGDVLYESPPMTSNSRPIRVSVSIAGRSGITLICKNLGKEYRPAIGWFADPKFITFKRPVPDQPRVEPPVIEAPPIIVDSLTEKPYYMSVRLFKRGGASVTINGQPLEFGAFRPREIRGRFVVPMRTIFEGIGVYVEYQSATKMILARRGQRVVTMVIGEKTAIVDKRMVQLDAAPETNFGTTYVPLRFVAEAFDVAIDVRRD